MRDCLFYPWWGHTPHYPPSPHLRAQIQSNNDLVQTWPHTPTTVGNDSVKVPPDLKQFVVCLLSGQLNPTKITKRLQWLVGSFVQDIIYAVSNGNQKPSKHLLLAYAVKSLSGNVELLQALNHWFRSYKGQHWVFTNHKCTSY